MKRSGLCTGMDSAKPENDLRFVRGTDCKVFCAHTKMEKKR